MTIEYNENKTIHAELVPLDQAGDLVALDDATLGRAHRLIEDGTPEETKLAYARDLRYLEAWAEVSGLTGWPMHPDVVVRFITEHLSELPADVDAKLIASGAKRKAGPHSVATVERRVSTIASYHRAHGHPAPTEDPRVRQLLKAGRRLRAKAGGQAAKRAATLDVLDAMLRACGDDLIGVRDRALLLFAWASGGRRRSEVAAADVANLAADGEDFVYTLPYSKTDQAGEGLAVPIAGRAADALRAWLEAGGISGGAIFRGVDRHGHVADRAINPRTVARVVQRRANQAGYNAADFAAHSLRSGFVTEAGRRGVGLVATMELTGHKTPAVAARYHRSGAVLEHQAARLAG